MSGGIFISYRRDDAKHAAGRLMDRLEKTYRRDQLFMDVDGISPGLDFVKVLSEKVQACEALLAIIGPTWLEARNEKGGRRLDDPHDFVRIEIEAALQRDVRVIPVLVDGAQMPHREQLPESLQDLTRRQAVRLVHERFGADADGLATALEQVIPPRQDRSKGWFGRVPKSSAEKMKPEAKSPNLDGVLTHTQPEPPSKPTEGAIPQTTEISATKRSIRVAAAFAILQFPIMIALTLLIETTGHGTIPTSLGGVHWSVWALSIILVFELAATTLAVSRRGLAITGLEIAMYWFGLAWPFMLAAPSILEPFGWRAVSSLGVLMGILTGLSGYLIVRRGKEISAFELFIFWLSISGPIVYFLSPLYFWSREPVVSQWGWPILIVITGFCLLIYSLRVRRQSHH